MKPRENIDENGSPWTLTNVSSSQRSGGDGWSEVERRFFETAPPDIAIQPAAPHSFDDLEAPLPERRRQKHARAGAKRPVRLQRQQAAEKRDRWSPARRAVVRAVLMTFTTARDRAAQLVATARASAQVWWQRRVPIRPSWALVRELVERGARTAFGPVLAELPEERANRRSILVGVAAIVVVVGLAAGVLGSYVPHLASIR
jgi:hypothetical protein